MRLIDTVINKLVQFLLRWRHCAVRISRTWLSKPQLRPEPTLYPLGWAETR